MAQDRDTIGLTAESQQILARLEKRKWFAEAQDIARLALAYAIREKVEPGDQSKTETRWAAGNFDKTGDFRTLLGALYPSCTTPVRLMEHLVNEGLRLIDERVADRPANPAELLEE